MKNNNLRPQNKIDEIPDYINCNSKVITHCDFYMHNACPQTCSYAIDIGGVGVGAMTENPKITTKNIEGKTNEK